MHDVNILLTILLYAIANFALWSTVRRAFTPAWLWRVPACAALLLHGFLLYQWIDHGHLQDLAWSNILSMTAWLSGILIVLISTVRPVQNLTLLIFPLAIITMVIRHYWLISEWFDTQANVGLLIHVLLSILALSVWWIALIQALLLTLQNYLLRRQINLHWLSFLPAVESMESLFFQFIIVGFILLTVTLISAFLLAGQTTGTYFTVKAVLSGLAWVLYAILLVGRYGYNWRGTQVIQGAVLGFALLIIAYTISAAMLFF